MSAGKRDGLRSLNYYRQNSDHQQRGPGYFGDALVTALTAEPETIEELGLARFIKLPADSSPFERFRHVENFEPYDAGVMLIDLTARVIAADSSYSQPGTEGSFRVPSELAEDVWIPYRLSDDWLFVYSIPEYEDVREQRRAERLAVEPFDAREVLYGKALLEFIARECFEARDSSDEELFTKIHAKWLMTARGDLRGRTPREVLLEKQEFIDFDLHSRALQWSFTKECPPPLPLNSNAYRFSGFGTHENVVYYDMVRYLLGEYFEVARKVFRWLRRLSGWRNLKPPGWMRRMRIIPTGGQRRLSSWSVSASI